MSLMPEDRCRPRSISKTAPAKSALRRGALRGWARHKGLDTTKRGDVGLLQFLSPDQLAHQVRTQFHHTLNCTHIAALAGYTPPCCIQTVAAQVVQEAVLCHTAPRFSVTSASIFADLPVHSMLSLLQHDNLGVGSELETVLALEPWIAKHSPDELVCA